MDFFLRHPLLWWRSLSISDRRELLAAFVGACVVVVTTWFGVRNWWRRWKRDRNSAEVDDGNEE